MVDFLFKFPTRSRKRKFFTVLDRYYEYMSGEYSFRFIVTMDNDDKAMRIGSTRNRLDEYKHLDYYYGPNKTKIQAINANMDQAPDFKILFLVSDDMVPQVRDFDRLIMKHMKKHFPDFFGALHYNDGRVGKQVNTLSIMGKPLYDYFGYIYHPDYKSLWCDNEFHDVTKQMGKTQYIDKIIVKHEWPGANGDPLYRRNENLYTRDKKVYEKRANLGFPQESIG
jgi:hypothetical protein